MQYIKIGNLIKKVSNNKNTKLLDLPLLGLHIEKKFMPSVANVIGTDMSKYQIIKKWQFAYTGMQVGRDESLHVALYTKDRNALITPAYTIFEVADSSIILPEYLMLYLRRSESDRLGWFYSDSSVRSNLDWDRFCSIEMLVPSIEIQTKIVNQYNQINNAITIKKQLNNNLEQQAQAIFINLFPNINIGDKLVGDYISPNKGKNLLSKDAIEGDIPVVAGGINASTYHNLANTKVPVVTISASGVNAGYINLWNTPVWSSDSSFIDNSVTPFVYFWYCLLKNRQKEIFDMQIGTAQPHIYPKHIEGLSINDLTLYDISGFNSKIEGFFYAIGKNTKLIKKLTTLKETLLPKIMSSELSDKLLFSK